MVNRIDIISVAAKKVRLPTTKANQYIKQLDKALGIVLSELPLVEARQFSEYHRKDLESALREAVALADLKKISKKWEPKRKIESGATQTEVTNALVELLYEKRGPYEPITFTLEQARNFGEKRKAQLQDEIERLAPLADLRKLARKWDKHNKSLPNSSRKEMSNRLLSLLNEASEPSPPPPKKSARKK